MRKLDFKQKPVYSIAAVALSCGGLGLLMTAMIFGAAASPASWDFVTQHSSWVLFLCPPSIAGMGMDHAKGLVLFEGIALIAVANAALYSTIGLVGGLMWKIGQVAMTKLPQYD